MKGTSEKWFTGKISISSPNKDKGAMLAVC